MGDPVNANAPDLEPGFSTGAGSFTESVGASSPAQPGARRSR